ncbi:MAG: hypothetical protein V3V67_05070 [Myxococcota bacterium]
MTRKATLNPDAALLELEGHGKPVSRRDFLARGLISGAGLVMVPSWLQMFAARRAGAQALDCGIGGAGGKIPFLCLDLRGGANIAGSNALVGGPGGQLDFLNLDGYQKLGLPGEMTPDRPGQINSELGLAFHVDSAFLRGIISKTSQTTRDSTNGSIIAARSSNDTDNNPHNPVYGIAKAGAQGNLLALIGTRNSESGGRSEAPGSMIDPALRPTKVASARDATGLVDTGQLLQLLDQAEAGAVMSAMEQLSDLKLLKTQEDQALEDLIRCNYVQTTDLVANFGNPAALDPSLDPDIVGANGIFTVAEFDSSRFEKTAAVMKLVIEGYAGAGTIENGGYDYHDSTRATGEVRDFAAGQMMGACLEFAARRGQPLMLYVLSDGSVASNGTVDNSANGRGKLIWRGDNSSTAASLILVYDPAGRPQLSRPEAAQIGYFRPDGSVETASTRVANNVELLAQSIVLNYMALHNEVGMFDMVLPDHGLGAAVDLDALIAFAPIR